MVHIVLERTATRPPTDLVAKTEVMKRLLAVAARVAETSARVLLVGESGTGKDRLARYLHEKSRRANTIQSSGPDDPHRDGDGVLLRAPR
jgi:DNA-binding NtrC family response regulator